MKDINLVRTAQDLERKYNLSSIGKLKRNYELQKDQLTKVENEITEFAKVTTKEIEDLKNQVDGNITTWFSSGLPTLENYPASEWLTDEEKNNHLGDLYYDQDTGYSYRFIQKDDVYLWLEIVDSDVAEALAIANSAKDTADRKRQVFVVEPMPPYDVGDLWIRDEEIYRCQTSKPSGELFEENDWIKATKYTDDTVANQIGNNLTILSGTVTEIKNGVDELSTKMTATSTLVEENGNKIGALETKTSETSQTVEGIKSTVSTMSTDVDTLEENRLSNETRIGDLESSLKSIKATVFEQTEKDFTMWFEQTGVKKTLDELQGLVDNQNTTLDELRAYIRYGTITDISSPYYKSPYIELGKENAQTRLRILDNRIQFLTGEIETAYISNNALYINESTILTKQVIGKDDVGKWITEIDEEGNLNTYWGGVE